MLFPVVEGKFISIKDRENSREPGKFFHQVSVLIQEDTFTFNVNDQLSEILHQLQFGDDLQLQFQLSTYNGSNSTRLVNVGV